MARYSRRLEPVSMSNFVETRSPMNETEAMYLFQEDRDLARKYGFAPKLGGKWILFVAVGSMNSMWKKCSRLYLQGKFIGIKSIKCSTKKPNPRQSTTNKGVIIFHCGPYTDAANILSYGRNIVEKLNYFSENGFIPYKSDAQTAKGTRATGNPTNSMYWIPVPKTRVNSSLGKEDSSTVISRTSRDKSPTRSILNQALIMQENVHKITKGKLQFRLVLGDTQQGCPAPGSDPTSLEQAKQSRIMEFKIRDVLGSGGFAIVFRAYTELDDQEYAIKRIPLPNKKEKQDRVLREVKVLAKLNHPNVVRYFCSWKDTHGHDWVQKFDQPWKQELRNKCVTESFHTPVADSATITNYSSSQQETSEATSQGASQYESDSDEDLVPGKEYNAEKSGLDSAATSTSGGSSKTCDTTNTNSSNVQFQEDDSTTPTKTVAPLRSSSDYLYIQMELCERHSLKEWLAENEERPKQTVLKYFLDIVNAMEHVHDKKIMHRDLKPANIFFDLGNEFEVKVGDFGLGTNTTEDYGIEEFSNLAESTQTVSPSASEFGYRAERGCGQHTKNAGTFSYMSPEQRGRGKGNYTYKVDIFSLGLILFEMLWVMRTAQEKIRTLQDVRDMKFPDGFAEKHPEELALLQMMLNEDPNQRPTTRGIRAQALLKDLQLPHCIDGIKQEEHFKLVFKADQESSSEVLGEAGDS